MVGMGQRYVTQQRTDRAGLVADVVNFRRKESAPEADGGAHVRGEALHHTRAASGGLDRRDR